ncbi:uncharacterized protein LOC126810669 isoform X2 [Patella vulgata]|uniref:uncharacterized protein LOC126810669 isoform X2 n=1 Tax=Patella vulgata TaxID=6465 RepID=UPI0024A88C81|nr:uncharacterized protein LOC126810669 isoform X2 [Patella vulgata]
MSNMIKYLLLLITVFVIVECQTTYGCYRQPESPCSQHTLTCQDDQVIAVNEYGNTYIAYGRNPGEACPQDKMEICNATCCRHQHRNEYVRVNQTYRLSVYRNCSNQPTCTVTSPYSPNTSYEYMRYPYFCVPDNQSHNILEITDVNIQDAAFLYYSGKANTTSTTITRCCNIASTEPLLVESTYIDLTEESSYNVKIYSENQTLLPSGDGGGLFYGLRDLLISGDKIYHVVLDNIPVDRDDYILIYIQAGSSNTSTACDHDCPNINITCDDCPAPGAAITNITCGDCGSPSTASSSSNTSTACDLDCPNINITCDDCPAPESSDGLGIIIGCVVGAVVVILAVVVVISYCIIRRKNKSGDNHQGLEYINNNNSGESEYNTIQDGDTTQHDIGRDFVIIAATPQKNTSETVYCDPWDTRIKLDPRTQPLDSKFQYSVVKPKDARRQGGGKPSEYDHISTKITGGHFGKEELIDPTYDHFKHNSLTPVVKDKTYYDHIPKRREHPLSDHYSDPTYNHLGEKGQTTKPQQQDNPTSNSHYQPNLDNPYTDRTYNHLRQPQRENYTKKNADDPYNDPTYNHLGEKGP